MPATALAIAGARLTVLLATIILLLFLLFIVLAPMIPAAAVRAATADPFGVSTSTTLISSIVLPFPPWFALTTVTVSLLTALGGGDRCHGDRPKRPSDQALEGVAAIWSRRQPRDKGIKLGLIHAANTPSSRSAAADAEKTISVTYCALADWRSYQHDRRRVYCNQGTR